MVSEVGLSMLVCNGVRSGTNYIGLSMVAEVG